jgi:energy-coupling factor transport system ATP-binding protein
MRIAVAQTIMFIIVAVRWYLWRKQNPVLPGKIEAALKSEKEKQKNMPQSLSGGQKQRLAIASAIASDRDIIVLDEPTSGLDLTHMREVAGAITQLLSLGKTVFIITHDRELAATVCSCEIRMEKGSVADT